MIDRNNYLFLLGGHDLEMLEIRKLLEETGHRFIDLNLTWGAKLSSYESYFEYDTMHVGIELIEDIDPPQQYIRIDHHNEESHKPASIEQIAVLLKRELNRYQRLVAANDKAYIPGLIEAGASEEEIQKIRGHDRKAQGVTATDEDLAEKSIRENLTVEEGVTVVKSLTSKFSTIADRLYGKTNDHLLVYTDRELTYYGPGAAILMKEMKELIEEGKAYAGGDPVGFFGIGAGNADVKEIHLLKDRIIHIVLN